MRVVKWLAVATVVSLGAVAVRLRFRRGAGARDFGFVSSRWIAEHAGRSYEE